MAVASIGILLVGAGANEESKSEAQDERVKKSFVELDKDVDSVSETESNTRVTELDLPEEADVAIRRENTGRITVNRTNLTTTDPVVVKNIGAIVYEHDDVHYAYQAGAVWSGTGNDTRMVSAPRLEYDTDRRGGSPTFTLPITDMEGPDTLNSGTIRVRKLETEAPLNNVTSVDNQLVTVKINSTYYVGWGNYFDERYENAVVTYDHPNQTTIIKLGRIEIDGSFDTGIVSNGDIVFDASGSDEIESGIRTGGNFQDNVGGQPDSCPDGPPCVDQGVSITFGTLDQAIATKAEDTAADCGGDVTCASSLQSLSGPGYDLDKGVYYISGDSTLDGSSDSIQADLSNGNVSIILDGDLAMKQAKILADNPAQNSTCCYLRIYFNGTDMAMGQSSGIHASTDNATRVQLYGTSEFHFDGKNLQSGGGWHAGLYAPGSASSTTNDALSLIPALSDVGSEDICFGQGSGTVDGAVIAGSVCFDQSVSFEYEEDFRTIEPTLGPSGIITPPVTYLHVSVNKVCVEDDTQTGSGAC
ncbi:hypothetical protein BRD00_06130 [Halobacteriales archaeon QS_8_69_26]|nr:MAG: hypothetical protein BRD00_06130 [Halobacteriales archaeon QS_8_69_26]